MEHVAEEGAAPGESSPGGQVLELVEKHILPAALRALAGEPDHRLGVAGLQGETGRGHDQDPSRPEAAWVSRTVKRSAGSFVFFHSRATA